VRPCSYKSTEGEVYASSNRGTGTMTHECCHEERESFSFDRRLKITVLLFTSILLCSFLPVPILQPLHESLLSYLAKIWWAVLLGLLLGGVIDYFVPEGFVAKYLGQKSLKSLLYAVVSGFLLSTCSHGILALVIQLHKKGASNAAIVAVLLAAPWANLPITFLLIGFFGWKSLLFIGAAMLIAMITGLIFLALEQFGLIEESPIAVELEDYSWDRIRHFDLKRSVRGVLSGIVSLSNMVLWWILIGFLFAAFIGAYVPSHIFMTYFGPSFGGLLLTLLAATFIEVCSEGSAPIAFEIFQQVGTLGNPFVFLMAGVVTDYTEIGLLWVNIGWRVALFLPLVTVPQVLVVGYLLNQFP